MKLWCVIWLATLMAGCWSSSESIEEEKICSLSKNAFAKNSFSDLLAELERQLGVKKNKMRITQTGIFIPVKSSFAEEQGYFVSKEKMIESSGTDPSFELVAGCVYRYKIKG